VLGPDNRVSRQQNSKNRWELEGYSPNAAEENRWDQDPLRVLARMTLAMGERSNLPSVLPFGSRPAKDLKGCTAVKRGGFALFAEAESKDTYNRHDHSAI
jgi:hypothetical protein